jgi:uncharacterized membrane protein
MLAASIAASASEGGSFEVAELTLVATVQWIKLFVEALGALIVGLGVVLATAKLLALLGHAEVSHYNEVRLVLARHLALALEFQLGADILSTAVAPSWEQIGKLGAIAVIRTGLNYFLSREMAAEQNVAPAE